jgi:hypothetical protein
LQLSSKLNSCGNIEHGQIFHPGLLLVILHIYFMFAVVNLIDFFALSRFRDIRFDTSGGTWDGQTNKKAFKRSFPCKERTLCADSRCKQHNPTKGYKRRTCVLSAHIITTVDDVSVSLAVHQSPGCVDSGFLA